MGIVLTGSFMVILDTTIITVGPLLVDRPTLPQIARDLQATDGIEWTVTAYLLAVAVVQLGIAAMAAPALGPVVGGYLTTTASWRWVFAVNIPIGALGVAAATRWLRDIGFREHRPLAWRPAGGRHRPGGAAGGLRPGLGLGVGLGALPDRGRPRCRAVGPVRAC